MTDKYIEAEAKKGLQNAALNLAGFMQPFINSKLNEKHEIRSVLRMLARYLLYVDVVTTSISNRLYLQNQKENDEMEGALSRLNKSLNFKKIKPTTLEVKKPTFNITLPLTSDYCLVSMWIKDYARREARNDIQYKKSKADHHKLIMKGFKDLELINENKYDRERELKLMRIYKVCCKLRRKLLRLPSLQVTVQDLLVSKPFPDRPFDKEYSEGFLRAAKKNELKTINSFLDLSRNLVFVYDWTHLTALHWAAKRGYSEQMQILLAHGADVHAEDSLEKTPLWYALHLGHLDCIVMLIRSGAVLPRHTSLRKMESLGVSFIVRKIATTLVESKYCQFMMSYSHDKQAKIHEESIARVLALAENNKISN